MYTLYKIKVALVRLAIEEYCKEGMSIGHEQYKQCTYNVTLKRVRATIVAVEKQQLLHIPSV
jgi:hypothetical protein